MLEKPQGYLDMRMQRGNSEKKTLFLPYTCTIFRMKNRALSVTSHINCIVSRCLIMLSISHHVPLSGHDDVAFFE